MPETITRSANKADFQSLFPRKPSQALIKATALCLNFLVLAGLCWGKHPAASVVLALLAVASIYSNVGYYRIQKARLTALGAPDAISVMEIHASRVFEPDAGGSAGPALCFDLGGSDALLLCGQWLLEPSLYRCLPPLDERLVESVNNLPDPHSFPAAHFKLHFLASEREPFWIEVLGHALVAQPHAAPVPSRCYKRFALFEADFDRLDQSLPPACENQGT